MKHFKFAAALLFATALISVACTSLNPYFTPAKPHHRADGFVNTDGTRIEKNADDLWAWVKEKFNSGLPTSPSQYVNGYSFPVLSPDREWLANNRGQTSFTWLGHATMLLQTGGLNVIFDPIFSERASAVQWLGPKRKVPVPMQIKDLPVVDVVLISHNHFDHMDADSVIELARQFPKVRFLVPLGTERWFKQQGIENVRGMDWWETDISRGTEFHFVPARHWSVRNFLDRNENLWGGWVVKNAGHSFFFSGDTGYSDDFKNIGARFGDFDLAALPVGAYEPRWFMRDQHINPDEAMKIHQEVGAKKTVGVHWGTFELSQESLDAPIGEVPAARERARLDSEAFILIKHGETLKF
jgi:L-ascorbate metabolism protein UlaG (beta-lactamase superfamily)